MSFQQEVEDFLDDIAAVKNYDRATLSIESQLRNGGATVQPNPDDTSPILSTVKATNASEAGAFQSAWYDNLGSDHLEYRVIQTMANENGTVTIPRVLFSFQHHVMPGCCQMSVQRWVRIFDDWNDELKQRSLIFRARLARHHAGTSVMFITTGASGRDSAESLDVFTEVFNNGSNRAFTLNLREFLS